MNALFLLLGLLLLTIGGEALIRGSLAAARRISIAKWACHRGLRHVSTGVGGFYQCGIK